MEPGSTDRPQAARQLSNLESLVNKYRHLQTVQSGLLRLSEMAKTTNNLDAFFAALEIALKSLFVSDNFHIALIDEDSELVMAYCHNPQESVVVDVVEQEEQHSWRQSLTGIVVQSGELLHCDAAQRLALTQAGKLSQYQSMCTDWLGVPIHVGDKVLGAIALQSYEQEVFFDEADGQLLKVIAGFIAQAMHRISSQREVVSDSGHQSAALHDENQQLKQQLTERDRLLKIHSALLNIAQSSSYQAGDKAFYRKIHTEIERVLCAKKMTIAALTKDRKSLNFPYVFDGEVITREKTLLQDDLVKLTIDTGAPIMVRQGIVHSLSSADDVIVQPLKLKLKQYPIAFLATPLVVKDKIVGVLTLEDTHQQNAYEEGDLKLIRFIAKHVAVTIERFNQLTNINASRDELEKRVEQRTKALEATNVSLRKQIEERGKAEEQLYHDAHHDALTKLPNRALFSDRLDYALKHVKRHPQHNFAVLFIDLDRFKVINDTLGHHMGDLFLMEIANRLQECVREHDVLARLGGDEFVVLLSAFNHQEDVEDVCTRIIDKITVPYELEGQTLHSGASIGIAMCTPEYQDSNAVLRDADTAMYQAKSLGKGRYMFFDESMREQLVASLNLEQELRDAVAENQFELHFQKINALNTGQTIGFEAFLRWQHPTKGVLTPSSFLFMAEELGLVQEIEQWVIEHVCDQLNLWHEQKEFKDTFISINLSPQQLTKAGQTAKLIKKVKSLTKHHDRLILEFNESAFIEQEDAALKSLRQLRNFGVKLALDDYGKGVSSFNFIHNYPFEFIKLDRSFTRSLMHNEKNLPLIKALNELGNQYGYRIVAEGIESQALYEKLVAAGCEFGQGFHLHRPQNIAYNSAPLFSDLKKQA
ncbi:EAL domain-containing protein [Thalassotalea agarivorans]|uniref:Diguanylate cyclase (GGDEF) domain-containing protein n=1 Tax=Thalassotalea agarivorans TaxID=349064 RepID=A0A1I0EA86_THASX|nr:EAL domain-containing protein [Thalassotalea agarivorans]SET42113.1 diguanylate cyclase (GGDEF) domain-containing protein [Thalassotalea agarivorans]